MDPRLLKDSAFLGNLNLCELRLMKDGDLDWMILIPKREGVVEWMDLSSEEQQILTHEITLVSRALQTFGKGDKLNIGSLGNIVSQFHLHIVYRKKTDRAWPGSIWGTQMQSAFNEKSIEYWRASLGELFQT